MVSLQTKNLTLDKLGRALPRAQNVDIFGDLEYFTNILGFLMAN
jgi:hypothetical protein